MSGGSFNYLYSKELSDLFDGFGTDWDDMLTELDTLCPEAATEMRKIQTELRTFQEEHEKRWAKLQPVLRAIEWWVSWDWGEDQVNKVIKKYKAEL